MSSILGAALVGVGCAGAGLLAAWQLREKVKLLQGFSLLLERLSGEIGYRLTPLPEMSARLGNHALRDFWKYMDEHYSPLGGQSYGEVWKSAAGQLELSPLDKELIGDLGHILGQYDPEQQLRSLDLAKRQLDISLDLARDKHQKQGKLYRTAGLLCGLLIFVLTL